ncbi:DNA polymerase I [Limihaloglobus sulfuriphilus]|uniref:DNA polymerase I n=1 Tax=Limihaloglobus sulfuriphilus TaxID=1851148 RepID=A0A1Q2MCM3_9BACT|nr:DNA polymerase I [Limihaloglobus sulfuriphilus]AQQ70399.1 DNA polymerase I [Limihaloglobus sulfuriphilus]
MSKDLYILDGHSHIYSAYYAPMSAALTSPAGEPTKAVYIFTNILMSLIKRKNPEYVVVAMDSKGKGFRGEIYPEYKSNRPPMPEDLRPQIERVREILDALRIPAVTVENFEADDVIGTLSRQWESNGGNVYICSKDKDMQQLINKSTCIYDIQKDKVKDENWIKNELGIDPVQFIDVLALQGDSIDNVPGVPDVGPKTAIQWIAKYGTIENLYEHADDIKGKRGKSLRDNKEQAIMSKKLVTIDCDAPVQFDLNTAKLQDPDTGKLTNIFSELGFTKLAAAFDLTLAKPEPKSAGKADLFAALDEGQQESPAEYLNITTVKHDYRLVNTPEKLEDMLKDISRLEEFAIDTETTSLNPVDASLVGISLCGTKGLAYYLPVKAPMGDKKLETAILKEKLGPILTDSSIKKIGQNIKYDLIVLENAGFELKGVVFDTMIASYVLAAERNSHSMDNMARDYLKYECMPITELIGKGKKQRTFDSVETALACEYAAEDADITWQLYQYLKPELTARPQLEKLFNEIEMPLLFVLKTLEQNGVALNISILKQMSQTLAERIEILSNAIYDKTDSDFNIDSPKQLSEVLFDKLGLPQVKKRSTDIRVLEELRTAHSCIDDIIEYRQLTKLKNTYIDKLPTMISQRSGKLHASFNQTVTATGRLSSSNPNLQNIPIRTEIGRKIRSAFVPGAADHVILSADYSQIELRILAHLSQDPGLMEAFADGRDIHSFVAHQIFNVPLEDVTPDMRSKCKAVNYGIIYGQGAFGLSNTIGISQTEAREFINSYFKRYSSIKMYMESSLENARKKGYAETMFMRRRPVSGINSSNYNIRSQAERMAFNTILQGSAADLIKIAMINIQRRIDEKNEPVRMILQVHDELVFEVPEKNVEEHSSWIVSMMENAVEMSVPIIADCGWGKDWSTGH